MSSIAHEKRLWCLPRQRAPYFLKVYGTEAQGLSGRLLENSAGRRLDAVADLSRQLGRALRNLARDITSEEGTHCNSNEIANRSRIIV